MKSLKILTHLIFHGFVWHWLVFFQPIANAQEIFDQEIDCTDVSINFVDDPNLTLEERIRLMDEALLESLNRFELCQEQKKMAKALGGAGSNGTKGGLEGSAGESKGSSGKESIASSEISGTRNTQNNIPARDNEVISHDNMRNSRQDQDNNESAGEKGKKIMTSNGKTPEDIPPAKNDDALAAQIRYAAENETDPVKKRQLWNEYRKYKGLPTQ